MALLFIEEFHMRGLLQLGILLSLAYSAISSEADMKAVYTIDPAQSEFVVQLFKAGAGSALAHDHVVRATEYTGQIQADPTDPTTASITVEVKATSLKADEPALRQKYGLTSSLSEKDRQEIQASMESQNQLSVKQYPTITFQSTRIEPQAEGQYTVTGKLTIRGVTQPVTFPVRVERRDGAIRGWGSFRFLQSSFGYEPYSAFLGAVRNQDEVVLHFDLVATPGTEKGR
jgi:polyisoprenoid-binding protein YceI